MAKLSDKIKQSSVSDRIRVAILAELENISAVASAAGLATEATALNILNAIVASGQDVEVLLVRDTGDSNKVLQQITDYITSTTIYKDVNGNVVVPVGPLEYLDPSAVLNLILTQNTSLNTPVTGLSNGGPLRITDATGSPIAAGKRRISCMNVGATNGSINGGVIKPGESLTWVGDGLRDTLASMAYDGTGTELLITYVG
jgi:hypothetical protein